MLPLTHMLRKTSQPSRQGLSHFLACQGHKNYFSATGMQPSAGTEVVQLMEERKSLRTFCSGSAVLTYPFQQGCEQCQTAWETSTPALTPAKIVQLSLQRLSSACPCAFSGQSGENENLMVIWFFVCTGQQPWQRNGPKSLLSMHTHCCSSLFPLLLVFPF